METNTVILNDLKFIINSNITWSKLENKTILISGANGFLASYIVKAILYKNTIDNLNCKVIALVRNIENAVIRFQDFLQRIDLVIINHDIINPILISDTVDFVIHAASQASPKYYGIDPIGTIQANTLGTYNLLQFAKNKNVESFLFCLFVFLHFLGTLLKGPYFVRQSLEPPLFCRLCPTTVLFLRLRFFFRPGKHPFSGLF